MILPHFRWDPSLMQYVYVAEWGSDNTSGFSSTPGTPYDAALKPDEEVSVLDEAKAVTRTSRTPEYDHPLINFLRMAYFWNGRLMKKLKPGEWITPEDVAWMMIESKDARAMKTYKRDNVVDTAGYADCIGRIDAYMKQLGYQDGIAAFSEMSFEEGLALFARLEDDLA